MNGSMTNEELMRYLADRLTELAELVKGDSFGSIAVAQMRHWAELLQTTMIDKDVAA
jgi:signal recognition particle GTPase